MTSLGKVIEVTRALEGNPLVYQALRAVNKVFSRITKVTYTLRDYVPMWIYSDESGEYSPSFVGVDEIMYTMLHDACNEVQNFPAVFRL